MKKIINIIVVALLAVETVLLVLSIAVGGIYYFTHRPEKEEVVYSQSSPDQSQTVVIYMIGEPDWPFGCAHYRVDGPGLSSLYVDVADDGGRGIITVDWKENAVEITFQGSEQKDAVYFLPFQ